MRNTFRNGLVLLMVLCLLVPLCGFAALASGSEELPIDCRFEEVDSARVLAADLTDDPYSDQQWNLKMIGMEEAWQTGLTGRGVRVAIIDCGVSTQTNDIDPDRLLAGRNTADETQSTEDTEGHGTFVAGIIGATKDNGVGIAGIAPGATIVPLKFSNGATTHIGACADAFYAAVDDFHCDVINFSTGTTVASASYREMVQYAASRGVIVVCSVGNNGSSTLQYPAAFDEVIGVGSVDKEMACSSFSQRNESVFVTAPGSKITSLNLSGGAVRIGSGTSYSAPHVAGLAALLKEAHPEMNVEDFKEILKMSCLDLGEEGYDMEYGWGLIRVPEAIRAADEYFENQVPETPAPPEPSPEPGSSWSLWDLFNFDWLRDLFRNIIRNLFRGWAQNLTF